MTILYKELFLNHRMYVLDLHKDAKMTDAEPALTLFYSKLKLETTSEPLRYINYY